MINYIRKQIFKLIGIGYLRLVNNKNRQFGANLNYYHVKVVVSSGNVQDLLFTEKEILEGRNRAKINKEDYQ